MGVLNMIGAEQTSASYAKGPAAKNLNGTNSVSFDPPEMLMACMLAGGYNGGKGSDAFPPGCM
jgi:hypothetical protein